MLLVLSLPVFIETETILNFWLTTVPEHYGQLCSANSFVYPVRITFGNFNNGHVSNRKNKKISNNCRWNTNVEFPVSYVLLHKGFVPEVTIVIIAFRYFA